MNRGFHAFFRQYYNLRALLRRADPHLSGLLPVEDYPLIDAAGHRDTSAACRDAAAERAGLRAAQPDLPAARPGRASTPRPPHRWPRCRCPRPTTLDDLDAETFLRDINFPDAARHLAFEVFARSFFARPETLSAAELATMFHIYFLGRARDWSSTCRTQFRVALWNPLRGYWRRRGVRFRTGRTSTARHRSATPARGAHRIRRRVRRRRRGAGHRCRGLRRIVGGLARARRRRMARPGRRLRTAPPFVVLRLWLDRPVAPTAPRSSGTGGRRRWTTSACWSATNARPREWAARTGGSVVELHAYAVTDVTDDERARRG